MKNWKSDDNFKFEILFCLVKSSMTPGCMTHTIAQLNIPTNLLFVLCQSFLAKSSGKIIVNQTKNKPPNTSDENIGDRLAPNTGQRPAGTNDGIDYCRPMTSLGRIGLKYKFLKS